MKIAMKVIFCATICVLLLFSSISCQRTPKDLMLTIENPTVVSLNESARCTIKIINSGETPVKDLFLRVIIPTCLQYGKQTAEKETMLRFKVGEIKPREIKKFTFNVRARKTGKCENKALLFLGEQSSEPILTATSFITVGGRPGVSINTYDTEDPVQVGKHTIYVIEVRNEGSSPITGIQLSCILSDEIEFVTGSGPNVSFKLKENRVTFDTYPILQPGKRLNYKVTCRAIEPGVAKFTSTLQYHESSKKIIAEEKTHIYN
jgi:uncharacterized repeat protein (TIGR01451 family)